MQRMGCKDLKVTDFPSVQFCSKCYVDNKGVQAEMNTPLENISDLLLLEMNILPLWFVLYCTFLQPIVEVKGIFNYGIRQNAYSSFPEAPQSQFFHI